MYSFFGALDLSEPTSVWRIWDLQQICRTPIALISTLLFTVNLLGQYVLSNSYSGGAPFRTTLQHAIHLEHTVQRFKNTANVPFAFLAKSIVSVNLFITALQVITYLVLDITKITFIRNSREIVKPNYV